MAKNTTTIAVIMDKERANALRNLKDTHEGVVSMSALLNEALDEWAAKRGLTLPANANEWGGKRYPSDSVPRSTVEQLMELAERLSE
jgi:N-acyl-D-aspartate/D-glutamate deacylase